MTARDKATLKGYFNTGDTITEPNLADLIDTIGSVTLTVAASDATDASKGRADYVCDGVDDHVEILAAINALPAVDPNEPPFGGGRVLLSEGTFNCTSILNLDGEILVLEGMGREETHLVFTFPSVGDCIALDRAASLRSRVVLRNFSVIGDDVNTQTGIRLGTTAAHNLVQNVSVWNMTEFGIEGLNGNSQNTFIRVYVRDADKNGFKMFGSFNTYYSCIVSNSPGNVGQIAGFQSQEQGSHYFGCVAERFASGFYVTQYAYGVGIFGCYFESNSDSIFLNAAAPDEPDGILISGGLSTATTHESNGAIRIWRSKGVVISGLRVRNTASGKDFDISSNAVDATIIGGSAAGATPVSNAGTRTRIINLNGYVSETRGAQASVADGGTIAHGLAAAPTFAQVQTSIASEFASVTALDATNITVAIKNDTGGAGTTQTIYWEAQV